MPSKSEKITTKSTTQKLYGGMPCDIDLRDLSTYRRIVKYFYFLEAQYNTKTTFQFSKMILDDLLHIGLGRCRHGAGLNDAAFLDAFQLIFFLISSKPLHNKVL